MVWARRHAAADPLEEGPPEGKHVEERGVPQHVDGHDGRSRAHGAPHEALPAVQHQRVAARACLEDLAKSAGGCGGRSTKDRLSCQAVEHTNKEMTVGDV